MLSRFALALSFAAALLVSAPDAGGAASARPKSHTVYAGQRLGSIAKRYNVSIEALCTANGLRERDPIRPGQKLVIPNADDRDGTQARDERLARERPKDAPPAGKKSGRESKSAWTQYQKQPRRKGYVEIMTHRTRWRGLVLDSKGHIRAPARKAITALLDAGDPRPKPPDGLIRLMVRVSDTFGGRPLHVVSGFRTTSYFKDSRHKSSEAVDFAVVGVPNTAVRDYLMTLGKVGVGYYPNSTFVHLDVRQQPTYWTDYAGPGEAPRKMARRAPQPMDFDDLAEEAAASGGGSVPEAREETASPAPESGASAEGESRPGSLPAQPPSSP